MGGRTGDRTSGNTAGTAKRKRKGSQLPLRRREFRAVRHQYAALPIPDCQPCVDLAALRDEARARNDGTAETDANVLLRRHQHRDHDIRHRRIFRFVPYAIVQDPSAEPEYEARCVSGDENDCGAESGPYGNPTDVEEWQRKHTQETRRTRYRRSFADYAVLEPQK
ncbi:hypothetical protein ABT030_03020 [Streptomyces mirabilis]|uniref:DUF7848 domain-containing protein n=1 Tax=Streptomyces mirabilis TaxID=68239 RepID=UPI003316F0CE